MFENLWTAFDSDTELDLATVFLRLVLALALGIIVALVHRLTRARIGRQPDGALAGTLVMLCVLLALTTVVVGDNVARAFSIVGALSIVRFRTVVEDTRDTAFVVFAVAIGLAVGAGYLWLPLLAIPVVAVAAMHSTASAHRITIRTGIGFQGWKDIEQAFAAGTKRFQCCGAGTRRGGTEQDRYYEVVLESERNLAPLLDELSSCPGVLTVDIDR
ncbi:MAG: DUF4956 domain-containing protein [Planctomycetota bacterium]|nr:DUF4956 domain-containing protein [Planctomycetota bacterium]